MIFLEQLFSLLSDNKKLPYYQAERRIDIFINFYLAEILNHFLLSDSIKYVAPEFPLKKINNATSTKIDYLCFDNNKKEIYFVELKTDDSSFKESQLEIYRDNQSWENCLNGLQIIQSKTKKAHKIKFELLKDNLKKHGLLSEISNTYPIKIVYILPSLADAQKAKHLDLNFITFNDLIDFTPTVFPDEWRLFCEKILYPKAITEHAGKTT